MYSMPSHSASIAQPEEQKSNVHETKLNTLACDQTEELLLRKHGYIKDKSVPISHTLQGELFVAINKSDNDQPVLIKRISSIDSDGMYYIINEELTKQSLTATQSNLATNIDCFQSETNCYCVIEYDFGASLKEFINQSHVYIKSDKLDIKEYHIKIQYLLWKLIQTINMLHVTSSNFPLDLCPENIFVRNCDFIPNSDGTVKINPDIEIKLIDFPRRYNTDSIMSTYITKYMSDIDNMQNNLDGHSSDMFSFGIILYYCCFGKYPFPIRDDEKIESKYTLSWAICNGKLGCYFAMNCLLGSISKYCLKLLNGLLNIQHHKRLTANQVLNHKWFNVYQSSSLV